MRASLPLMLFASLALHVGLAAGIALTYFHGTAMTIAVSAETPIPTLVLLRSMETSNSPRATAVRPAAPAMTPAAPIVVPVPAPPLVAKDPVALAPTPSLALEINPNAHVRALPPEAVLSPSPAPQLDGKAGVVFLLDISGSMYEPYAGATRLAFARQALSEHIRALPNGTPFAITLYAARAQISGPLVAANDATRDAAVRFIRQAIDCGGGTNLPAGLALAQQLHTGRLVLVTDGDLNSPEYEVLNAERTILGADGRGPKLTIIAIGPRPGSGAKQVLQALVRQEGGTCLTEQFDSQTTLLTAAANAPKPVAAAP